ncbi:MAG: hypothetical protein ACFFH0_11960 [Promethearchaeota archaeon]
MRMIRKVFRDDKGFVLPTALLLLVLGGLLVVPSLYLLQTTLKSNQVVDIKTAGVYAADAGIEDALWKYVNDVDPFVDNDIYTLEDEYGNDLLLNNMTVEVEMTDNATYRDGTLYTIKSVAKLNGVVKAEIEACPFIAGDFAWVFNNAIISPGTVNIDNNCSITGNVTWGTDLIIGNGVTIDGDIIHQTSWGNWPLPDQLSWFYLSQVDTSNGYTGTVIDVSAYQDPNNPYIIGSGNPLSLYRQGNLTIMGNNGYARLDGTLYVTGVLAIEQGCTLDLNGQAIFCDKNSVQPEDYVIRFKPGAIVKGPGCIVARGSIQFQPTIGSGSDDFIFIMSVDWETYMAPNGTFYGCLAGDAEVDLQPGCAIEWVPPPMGEEALNFPGSNDSNSGRVGVSLITYSVK